jgi:nucleoid-associated protein YgaU
MRYEIPSRYRFTAVAQQDHNSYYGLRDSVATDPRFDDRFYVIGPDDTLQSVAHRLLGDVRLWWVVAEFNDIIDPFEDLVPGERLRLPSPNRLWTEILA